MIFEDEPVPGYPLPIRPGHTSPGRFERVLRAGQFAVTTELDPPDSADPEEVYRRARVFDGYVDAINATDGSGANCHMSSLAVCALLTRVGYAPVMQISCRDNHFLSGRKITHAPRVLLGAAENPFADPIEWRAERLAKKVAAGAQFIQTQFCFDVPLLRTFMNRVEDLGLLDKVFVLVGVGPLRSAKSAEWIRTHVPGVHIPDEVVKRLAGASDGALEGRRLCIDLIQEIRTIKGVHGVHVMAYRQEEAVAEIIQRSGVLGGRVPWNPGRDPPANTNRMASEPTPSAALEPARS
ncbi:MAG: methylenetetrahydrofolate reductase [Gammaproteobacteria bacterium]|nr:MAG: methylenetetrahydrofolate reductase [Gammaproteobacteria bacterium]